MCFCSGFATWQRSAELILSKPNSKFSPRTCVPPIPPTPINGAAIYLAVHTQFLAVTLELSLPSIPSVSKLGGLGLDPWQARMTSCPGLPEVPHFSTDGPVSQEAPEAPGKPGGVGHPNLLWPHTSPIAMTAYPPRCWSPGFTLDPQPVPTQQQSGLIDSGVRGPQLPLVESLWKPHL